MKAKEKPLKRSLRGVEEILPSIFGQYKSAEEMCQYLFHGPKRFSFLKT